MKSIALFAAALGFGAALAAGGAAASPLAAGPAALARGDNALVSDAQYRRRVVVRRVVRPRRVVVRRVVRPAPVYIVRPRPIYRPYVYASRTVCRIRIRRVFRHGYYVPVRVRVCRRRY